MYVQNMVVQKYVPRYYFCTFMHIALFRLPFYGLVHMHSTLFKKMFLNEPGAGLELRTLGIIAIFR